MPTLLPAQLQPFTLAGAGVSIGDITIILSSMTDIDGVALSMANFGTIGFGTLEPGNGTQEEQISFSGITQNSNGTATLTGVKTVLELSPYTQSVGLAKSHTGGSYFVVSNTSGFYNNLIADIYAAIAAVVATGTLDATTTIKGKSKMSVAPVSATEPIAVGDNDPRLPTTDEKAALAGTGTPAVGNRYVTADTNALNELLANKDATTSLGNSDIKYPTQKAVKTYVDASSPTVKNGQTTYNIATASGNQVIAHGLGKTPKKVRLSAKIVEGAGDLSYATSSEGAYDGITNSCIYTYIDDAGNSTVNGNTSNIAVVNTQSGTGGSAIATVDATNITLAWTKAGSPTGTVYLLWEVQ